MSVNIFKNGILSKIAGAVGDAVPLINNFLTNQEGKGAADANTVYVLNNKIEELNSSLEDISTLKTIVNDETIIGTLNGKPLYRRVFIGNNVSISSNTTISSVIKTSDIDFLYLLRGTYVLSSNEIVIDNDSHDTSRVRCTINNDGLRLIVTNYTVIKYLLVLEYTKA